MSKVTVKELVNDETAASYGTSNLMPGMPGVATPAERKILAAAAVVLERLARHGDAITSSELICDWLTHELRGEQSEVFGAVWLDNKNRVIQFDRLFFGTIDSASVYPREVVKSALAHNARGVILAHNHPSGVADPSRSDESITQRIKAALDLVDVRVLDHIIIGDGQAVSLADRGLL